VSQEDEQLTGRRSDPDQSAVPADNSVGRLLTLSDGIFAISMTLLALGLQVPNLGAHPSDASLRHALAANADSYWSFLLTFYVIAGYWRRHRRLMRSVVTTHPALIRDTLALLLVVAAMPFPASMLGRYASEPITLAIFGGVNAVATLSLIVMSADVRRLDLADRDLLATSDYARSEWGWLTLIVFLLCIPAGYVFGAKGLYVLLLLALPDAIIWTRRIAHRRRTLLPT
jgi:uncharacterized membrane protein